MATSKLTPTDLTFTLDGTTIAARATASADAITLVGASSSLVSLGGILSPTSDNQAATKGYVDSTSAGLSWKNPVIAASVGDVVLATDVDDGKSLDGVVLSTGDRILLKNQTNAIENGLWVVSATGAPTRPSDFADGSAEASSAVFVSEGTTQADTGWVCTSDRGSDIVGTDNLSFVQFNGASNIIAGDGIDKSGNTISVDSTVVRTLGDQSISGIKTFNNNGVFNLGLSVPADNQSITVGVGADLSITHDGTDTTMTSTTGNLILDNTNILGSTINILGTDTADTSFQVQNDSGNSLFTLEGSGSATFSNTVAANEFTDTVLSITGGDITNAGSITATTFTDGTATLTGGDLTGLNTATDAQTDYAASVAYVLSKTSSPVNFTDQAVVTSFTNVNVAAPGASIDGVAVLVGDVVLLQGQTDTTEDGLYVYNGAAVPLTRTVSQATGTSALNDVTYVAGGSKAGFSYIQTASANYGQALTYTIFSGSTPAAGSDNNIQINVNGSFGGASNYNIASESATSLIVSDNSNIAFGTGSNFTITNDGTDTTLDNTFVTGSTIMKLGTDTTATDFQVQNDSGVAAFTVFGDSTSAFSGELSMSANKITNVADPTADQDAATKKYVDDNSSTPGGVDTTIQFNNAGVFGGISTITTNGTDMTFTGGNLIMGSSDEIVLGATSGLTIVQDGTNSSITSSVGNMVIDNTDVTGLVIVSLGTDTVATNFQVQNDSGSSLLTVSGSGSVAVSGPTNFNDVTQSTSSTTGSVVFGGGLGIAKNVFCSGSVNALEFNATSDQTKKTEIETISSPLDKVSEIRAVQYKFNFIEDDHLRYGVIAQQLQSIGLGDIVTTDDEGLKVDYNSLIGLLIGAVQELKMEVEAMK